ncbi:hypothetical protein BJX76DRAFT_366668 [Aspergillus varians]
MASPERPQILLLSLSYRDFLDETYSPLFDSLVQSAHQVESYIHNGGLAIVGLHFPNFTTMDKFTNFFSVFGLPWTNGDYHRSSFEFNPACSLPNSAAPSSFPAPYSMKVLHIKNAKPHEKVFVPDQGAQTQSLVFAAESVDHSQAAVTAARLGEGYLVYCGDVNGEVGSNRFMLALCGF